MLSMGAVEITQQFAAALCLTEMCPAALVMQAPALLRLRSSWSLDV